MVYFDNAATSFPKPESVIKEVNRCLKKYCGNPGRSSHAMSVKASEEIYLSRELVSDFFHRGAPECVVFTYNATHALNLAIKSYITNDCHVLTSDYEHNSVIRPLERLRVTHRIDYTCVPFEDLNSGSIIPYLRKNTCGIISSIHSNVVGYKIQLCELSRIANEHKLFLIIDGSQAVGHLDINLSETPCDVFCAPAHKGLYGIQGCGLAIFSSSKRKDSFIEGGSGSDSRNTEMPILLPDGYEGGTPGTPAIISLGCGIRYINEIGLDNMHSRINSLVIEAKNILGSFEKINAFPEGDNLISFNYGNVPSEVISHELDKFGICTRAGLHCAPSVHRRLGTIENGCVRLSFSYFNRKNELDRLYKALKFIKNQY